MLGGDLRSGGPGNWLTASAAVNTTHPQPRRREGRSCQGRPPPARPPGRERGESKREDQFSGLPGPGPDTSNIASLDEHRKKRAYRPRPSLRDLPDHLPRRTVMHLPAGHLAGCGCPACGLALREIGQDVSEVLAFTHNKSTPTEDTTG